MSRDLCQLADVKSYVPGYTTVSETETLLGRLITSESELIHSETGREIIARNIDGNGDVAAEARLFEITETQARLREIPIGDLSTLDGTTVALLSWDGQVLETITQGDPPSIIGQYEGEWQPTRPWEPITQLYFPWGRASTPVFIPLQILKVTGIWGFPSVPEFIAEACAARVIVRYMTDAATVGTEFAQALIESGVNVTALFQTAQDALDQLAGGVTIA